MRQTAYIYQQALRTIWTNLGVHILGISLKLRVAVEKEVKE